MLIFLLLVAYLWIVMYSLLIIGAGVLEMMVKEIIAPTLQAVFVVRESI